MPDDQTPYDALAARIGNAVENLDLLNMEIARTLKTASNAPDLAPDLLMEFNRLQTTLQIHQDLMSQLQPSAVVQSPQAPASEMQSSYTEASTPRTRRSRDPGMDFLLLEAFEHRAAFGYPIGQTTLHKLSQKLDAEAKQGSLVAKLNRWRNQQGFLSWSDPNDLRITDAGRAHRDKLYAIIMRDNHEDRVKAAFKAAWNKDVTFRKP